jgi:hypothetical protein
MKLDGIAPGFNYHQHCHTRAGRGAQGAVGFASPVKYPSKNGKGR